MSEPKRYTDLQVWEALHFAGSTSGWICWEDYARLKADVQRSTAQYNSIIDHQLAVIEGKQAEIDRLNAELFTCSCANANMNKHMNENARLKAEVETIHKDRDALFASHKTALADIQRLHWELRAAKEGKPSV